MIEATCHCGAVRVEAPRAPETVTDCTCSICRRLGVLWAYYDPAELIFATPNAELDAYVWGDKMIAFHRCRACGCTIDWRPRPGTDPNRMGLNARLFDLEVLASARVRHLDGADSETYVDE